jgi:hypothetical protein
MGIPAVSQLFFRSRGQLQRFAELKTDFAGLSLHNWIGAPLGTGCLYVKADCPEGHRSDLSGRVVIFFYSRVLSAVVCDWAGIDTSFDVVWCWWSVEPF